MTNQKQIIAVVGMTGSGKSVVSDFLSEKGYKFLRLGQITIEELKRNGLEPTEENEKRIREELRNEHGMAAFAILNKPKIDELLKESSVVLDGLYSWSELKYFREQYNDKIKVLAVNTPPEIRYSRLSSRTTIDEDMRNRPATNEQAKSRDYAEIENIEKGGPIAMADIIVNNIGTIKDLHKKLEEIFQEITKEKYIRPSWDEYFMEIAKTIAKRATCDRGRSGCVIARDKQLLVTGYVGSPKGLPHCDDVGHQFKKTIHEDGHTTNHCVRTVHAEQNAICQAAKLGISIKHATLYCKMTPCRICAMLIINSGIKKVVCEKRYHVGAESEEMFKQAGIQIEYLDGSMEQYPNM
jgi:dCMP deaminase